jgi:hypothetical protein
MPATWLDDPEQWWARGEHARLMAEQLADREAKRILLGHRRGLRSHGGNSHAAKGRPRERAGLGALPDACCSGLLSLERFEPACCIQAPPLITSSRRFEGRRPAQIVYAWSNCRCCSGSAYLPIGWLKSPSRTRRHRRCGTAERPERPSPLHAPSRLRHSRSATLAAPRIVIR